MSTSSASDDTTEYPNFPVNRVFLTPPSIYHLSIWAYFAIGFIALSAIFIIFYNVYTCYRSSSKDVIIGVRQRISVPGVRSTLYRVGSQEAILHKYSSKDDCLDFSDVTKPAPAHIADIPIPPQTFLIPSLIEQSSSLVHDPKRRKEANRQSLVPSNATNILPNIGGPIIHTHHNPSYPYQQDTRGPYSRSLPEKENCSLLISSTKR